MDEVAAFLDTNYLLHYPQPDQTDWWLNSRPSQCLIVCMAVIYELDDKKDHATLGGRAAARIKFIEQRHGSELCPNVRLEQFVQLGGIKTGDKTILEQVEDFKAANSGIRVVVVSEDYGMRIQCNGNGIETHNPNGKGRLDDPMNELQRENLALKKRLAERKEPELVLLIDEIEAVKSTIVKVTLDKPPVIPQPQIYAPSRPPFAERVDAFLQNQAKVHDESHRTIELPLKIKNVGEAPANDVTISIEFPKADIVAACYKLLIWGKANATDT